MRLNGDKYKYIAHTLIKHGWSCYQRTLSTIYWWVDPQHPRNDYRIKDAYVKLKERSCWDGRE